MAPKSLCIMHLARYRNPNSPIDSAEEPQKDGYSGKKNFCGR
jgi:hypothetical protein